MSRARLGKWGRLALASVALVLLDQATKFLAVDRLTVAFQRRGLTALPEKIAQFYRSGSLDGHARVPYAVWRPVWDMRYVENPGAAWGLFATLSPGLRQLFFVAISLAAVIFILTYYRRLREGQRFVQLALALILAGAVGNFIDRLVRRYVIDFIEWHWWNRSDLAWPTFNLADSLIVVGVALLVLHPARREPAPSASG